MDHITRIEQELDGFEDTLSLYRKQLDRWFNKAADGVSQAIDMPSLMNMERQFKFGNTTTVVGINDDHFSSVAQCQDGGVLLLESKFESVNDIPLGNIQVDVIAVEGAKRRPLL